MCNTAYCPITHLAMTAWPSLTWKQVLISMFTVCFDASGQEKEHPYVVVAGFISSAEEWIRFSALWNKKLHEYSLTSFRASDCQNYQGQFKGWKGDDGKRVQLWWELLSIIKTSTFYKFSTVMNVADWTARISRANKRKWKLTAYALCSVMCAERVVRWARAEGISTPIEYVFESGDPGSGVLKEHFESDGLPPPIFKHKTERTINGIVYPAFTPLQAADFLAYELFVTKKIVDKKKLPALGRPFWEFQLMPEHSIIFQGERLAGMETKFKKPLKIRGVWNVFQV